LLKRAIGNLRRVGDVGDRVCFKGSSGWFDWGEKGTVKGAWVEEKGTAKGAWVEAKRHREGCLGGKGGEIMP
jgi:hypothetical protein